MIKDYKALLDEGYGFMAYEFAERLMKKSGAAEDQKQLVEVPGDHLQSLTCSEAVQGIQAFLTKHEQSATA